MTRFEALFAPHLQAAYTLARWLTASDSAAHDVVQESAYRAFKYLNSFDGENPRAWFLSIVRNESMNWLRLAAHSPWLTMGEDISDDDLALGHQQTPEFLALQAEDMALLQQALQALAPGYREVIVLKDLEGLPYKDIAQVTGVPLGTVMSRLSRARAALRVQLQALRP
ncbi:sigma-70 family RNA polymerase sigma factor [Pseudomonas sp. RIT-To-2]|uniref:sigma-70 family RNA polymerase sigma factor n=1 Tax=Pseudomonas sp. RIT-To-2 TaxID=3462541 RepID=UPI0024137E97